MFLRLILTGCTLLAATCTFGQRYHVHHRARKFDLGCGVGLNYSQIGVNARAHTFANIYLEASAGYNTIDFAWHGGLAWYILEKSSRNAIRPFVHYYYGYNNHIKADSLATTYLGHTVGGGLSLRLDRKRTTGVDITVDYPIASPAYTTDANALAIKREWPIAVSFGFHYEF